MPRIHADKTIKTVHWNTMLIHDVQGQKAIAVLGLTIPDTLSDAACREKMKDKLYCTEER